MGTVGACKNYYIHKEMKTSMIDAAEACEKCSSRLATIKTEQEHEKLKECFMPLTVRAYVGLKDIHNFNEPYGYRWLNDSSDVVGTLGQITGHYFRHFIKPRDITKQCASYNQNGMIEEDYCTWTNRHFICERLSSCIITKTSSTVVPETVETTSIVASSVSSEVSTEESKEDTTTIEPMSSKPLCPTTETVEICEIYAESERLCKQYFIHKDVVTSMAAAANICGGGRLATPFSARAYVGLKDLGSYNEPYGYRWFNNGSDPVGTLGQVTAYYFRHFIKPHNAEKQCASYNQNGLIEEDYCMHLILTLFILFLNKN